MKNIAIYIIGILFIWGCSTNSTINQEKNDIPVYTFSKTLNIKNLTDSISFIALDDSLSEYLFRGIDKCIIHNSRIYILDYFGTSSIKVFNITGKYLFDVGVRGTGPHEFLKTTDFDITDHGIYQLDTKLKKIFRYDVNGKLISEYSYDDKLVGVNDFIVTNNQDLLLGMDINFDIPEQVILTDSNFNIKRKILSFSKEDTKNHLNLGNFKRCGKYIVYNYPISDKIYIFDKKGSIDKKYNIKLSKKEISIKNRSDYKNLSKLKKIETDLCYFNESPFIINGILITTLFYNSHKSSLCADLENQSYMLYEYDPQDLSISLSNFNFPVAVTENEIICPLDQIQYEHLDDISKTKINDKYIGYLNNGGILLVVYHLKNQSK